MPRIHDMPAPEGPRRTERADARRSEANRSTEGKSTSAASTDSLDISSEALQAQRLQGRLAEGAQDIPDVREDRVAQARARLAAGDYESETVRRIIADRLMEQLGL